MSKKNVKGNIDENMSVKDLGEIVSLMTDNEVTELEIEKNGLKIKLKKAGANFVTEQVPVHMAAPAMQMPQVAAQPVVQPAEAQAAGQPVQDDPSVVVVCSPMVGTFYSSPAPNADPFVNVGQQIAVDDTLCIVEAMKLMNEIKSELKGTVVDILVENGQAVEFDQPLFKIKTA